MGNCLVVEEKVIKIMKPDGKILEYKAPIRVQQVLSDFSGYAVSTSLQALQHLLPDTKLLGGSLYYLVPSPPPPQPKKKKVSFSLPEEEEEEQKAGVVRIKLVISKQQLQEMLQKGGISVDYMVSQQLHRPDPVDDEIDTHKSWKPILESIPELD